MSEWFEPEKWFAWRPVRTRDNGWVWRRDVWRVRWTFGIESWWVYFRHRRNAP
jgi:hypothetical protein